MLSIDFFKLTVEIFRRILYFCSYIVYPFLTLDIEILKYRSKVSLFHHNLRKSAMLLNWPSINNLQDFEVTNLSAE